MMNNRMDYTTKLKGLQVLLVEDNVFIAQIAQEELEDAIEAVSVSIAKNGAIALERLRTEDFDIILMDMHMPVMSGIEATRAIRKLDNGKSKIPIMAMTANVATEEVDRCFAAGMDDFISKPFKPEDLWQKLAALMVAKKMNL